MSSLEIGDPEFQRWYILIISSLTSALQCNTWFTFSSVPTQVEEYYHLKLPSNGDVNGTIDLLLNWGPIMAFPSIPLTAYILLFPVKGLKYSIKLSTSLVFIGCLIRCIPTILSFLLPSTAYSISNSFWNTLIFLHIGQILNAIAGVIIMSAPSKLSVIWFPERERKFATGCLGIAGALGNCFSFLCGPYLVDTATDIKYMLYLDLFLAFIPFICIIIYFPDFPTKLPSKAAKCALLSIPFTQTQNDLKSINVIIPHSDEPLINKYVEQPISIKQNLYNFWTEIKQILKSRDTVLMVLIGGFQTGISTAYNGVTQDMLSPLGLNDKSIGTIGTIQTGVNMIGALVMGWISDKWFNKRIKMTLYIVFTLCIIVLFILLFIVPNPWKPNGSMLFINGMTEIEKMAILIIFMAMLGFLNGALVPLFYELTSEVSYPYGISEGTSSTFLVLIINATSLVFIGVGNWLGTKYETISSVVVYGICVLMLLFVKETYQRLD